MLASIAVLQDDVEAREVVDDEARRAVRRRDRRVLAETDFGHDRGHERRVVRDHVEHGVVRAVVHRVEEHLELDRAVCGEELLRLDRDEREVVHVVVGVDESEVRERRGGGVGD